MPSKIQFDQLAVSWANNGSGAGVVTDEILKQTYRLGFDHCAANTCKRNCIGNPRCLSAIGGVALANLSLNKLDGTSSSRNCDIRDLSEPAGLKNLGATCYLNSLLQVWFHNAKFRDVILKWNRNLDQGERNSVGVDLPETIVGHIQLIFVRLLKSIRRSVDPTALVEVLGLDREYQQDASECCGLLFNVILEQLRTYADGSLANELANTYRGQQATVIQCESCGAVKRRQENFYNMILNVQGHRDVRQCIKSLGQRRKIEGDFTCGICASKKGGFIYEEFTEMPPCLNLQLMRYRFEAKSGTKKKVQTALRFPEVLDLSPFLKDCDGENLYELRAVLVHVGHSANSGHYVANVRTGEGGLWFRLNDENVSAMKGRPDLSPELDDFTRSRNGNQPKKNGSENGKLGNNGDIVQGGSTEDGERKTAKEHDDRVRLNDPDLPENEDDALSEVNSDPWKSLNGRATLKGKSRRLQNTSIERGTNDENTFTSTGAYMLVYERKEREGVERVEPKSSQLALHSYLERIVEEEHKENTRLAEVVESIRSKSTAEAQKLLTDFKKIYSELPYRENEDYRFIPTTSLSKVVKRTERLFRTICNTIEQPMASNPSSTDDAAVKLEDDVSLGSFACSHGRLTPESAALSKLKVISFHAASLLDEFCVSYDLSDVWNPENRVPQELCRECVALLGVRVARCSELIADHKAFPGFLKGGEDQESFWVSTKSLQNWLKMAENQILEATGAKPAKQVETAFNQTLQCTHGNLALDDKKTVPKKAWKILRKWFPSCVVYTASAPECDQCLNESNRERAIASQRADAMLILRQSLKGLMKFRQSMLEPETEAYAIHVDQAVKIRQYLRAVAKPKELPSNLPNALLCSHGKCLVFAKDGIFPESVVLLTSEESNVLRTNFSFDSFVKIQKTNNGFEISPDSCADCLKLRVLEDEKAQLEFTNVEIPVVKLALEELLLKHAEALQHRGEAFCGELQKEDSDPERNDPPLKRPRIRRIPNAKSIVLSSNDTFVDLKVKIMARHHITPILQIILNEDKLLRDVDGALKIRELKLRANSILYVAEDELREEKSDAERKKSVREEIGFGGTKLMG